MDEPATMVQPHQNELREAHSHELMLLMAWLFDGSYETQKRIAKSFEDASAWAGCNVALEIKHDMWQKLDRIQQLSQEIEDGRTSRR